MTADFLTFLHVGGSLASPRRVRHLHLAKRICQLGAAAMRLVGDELDNPPPIPECAWICRFALALLGGAIVGMVLGAMLAMYLGEIS